MRLSPPQAQRCRKFLPSEGEDWAKHTTKMTLTVPLGLTKWYPSSWLWGPNIPFLRSLITVILSLPLWGINLFKSFLPVSQPRLIFLKCNHFTRDSAPSPNVHGCLAPCCKTAFYHQETGSLFSLWIKPISKHRWYMTPLTSSGTFPLAQPRAYKLFLSDWIMFFLPIARVLNKVFLYLDWKNKHC